VTCVQLPNTRVPMRRAENSDWLDGYFTSA